MGDGEKNGSIWVFHPHIGSVTSWTWSNTVVELKHARKNHVAGQFNDIIMVAGGRTDDDYYSNSTEIFSPSNEEFSNGPTMHEKRWTPAGAILG